MTRSQVAFENMAATYLVLGSSVPGARVEEHGAFSVCRGPFQHPICNFAIVRQNDAATADEVKRLATARFNAYVQDDGADRARGLRRVGFLPTYRQRIMCATPDDGVLASPDVASDRSEVARFMADLFFASQGREVQQAMAEATAECAELALYEMRIGHSLTCAAMVSRTSGALGIYNLCVALGARGRGFGSEMLARLVSLAAREGRMATLQCDPSLENWYRARGFAAAGGMEVLCLSSEAASVIM